VFVVEVAGRRLAVEPLDLACCAVEVASAARLGPGVLWPDGVPPLPALGTVDAYVLLVAGTVTRAGADTVRARYEALPEPRRVVAYGACATTGGPYWDSYAVVPGVSELMPVDVVVPGCPPPPSSVIEALAALAAALPAAAPASEAGAR
jgi:NADH-quinone oxidoreductase subunit B